MDLRAFLLVVRGFWLHGLGAKSCGRWRQYSKLAEDPSDSIGRLGTNADPVLQSVGLESYFFDSLSAGNGIVGSEHLKEFAVSRRLGIGRHEAIKGRVRPTESLKSQSDDHGSMYFTNRWLCWCTGDALVERAAAAQSQSEEFSPGDHA